MGGEIQIIERVDIIQDAGGNVLLDGTDSSISAILLEDGFELRQESTHANEVITYSIRPKCK